MLTLRHKLTFGFSGLLALLLLVGTMGVLLLDQYSSTLEKIFKENYNSVLYSQQMKDAVDNLDDGAQQALWTETDIPDSQTEILNFEKALQAEQNNITLEGERKLVESLTEIWSRYKVDHHAFVEPGASLQERRLLYQNVLRPKTLQLKESAQEIIDLNLSSIISVDGAVKAKTTSAKNAMILLLLAGVVLASALIMVTTRIILKPLQIVTDSAREIERGNLDLTLPVQSRDELGQLAEAFNAMAAKLREFRRSNRAQLFRVQKTTQLALNSFPEAVAIIGLDGKVELANNLATQRFALEPGIDLLKNEHKILWALFQETFATLAPVKPKGYDRAIQMFVNGDEYFFLAQTVPIIDEAKLLNGVTLVLTDVTNLRRIDESKSGMLSVVSHELKTPLTSIRMATHLLLDERMGSLTPQQLELLIAARDDAERLHRIIENLLDMSRIESGRDRIDLKAENPEKIARESILQYATAARDQGVQMENRISDELPRVMVDSTRIPHVFGNLISNALKHTTAGGRIEIDAEWQEAEGTITFSVQNSGINIPEEYYSKIFDRFFRLDSGVVTEGVGLGLAITKDIVNAHGGRIWVEPNRQGSGARFCFTLKTENFTETLTSS